MSSKFNRQNLTFRNDKEFKNNQRNSNKGLPSSKDIEIATQAFLKNGGEIERVLPTPGLQEWFVLGIPSTPEVRFELHHVAHRA